MTLLTRVRRWIDDRRGVCRLCGDRAWRVASAVPPRKTLVHLVHQYDGEQIHGAYHMLCFIATREARYTYAEREEIER